MLINGAGGGSLALQIAKAHGVVVTGFDNTEKTAMLNELGADHVIDYTEDDVMSPQERYDFILDVAATWPYPRVNRLLKPARIYQIVGDSNYGALDGEVFGGLPKFMKLHFLFPFDGQLSSFKFELPERENIMEELKRPVEEAKTTPIVARTFSPDEVRLALQGLTEGKARGKVVITP